MSRMTREIMSATRSRQNMNRVGLKESSLPVKPSCTLAIELDCCCVTGSSEEYSGLGPSYVQIYPRSEVIVCDA